MGAVYEAEDIGLGRRVAVKLLNESFAGDRKAVSRFRREAKAAAAIRHPNIVTVHDTGTDDNIPFLVMELLEGESLSSLLRRERLLLPEVAAAIGCQMLAGLGAAHRKKVIHRDLKPGNVLLVSHEDGTQTVKILDFGISKFFSGGTHMDVTAHGAVIGTPRFMAPEQARGETDLDERVDVYSVGVLLYRMVTGKLPFTSTSPQDVIRKILEGDPDPPRDLLPTISEPLEHVILTALARNREARYASADDFIFALEEAVPELVCGHPIAVPVISNGTGLSTTSPASPPLVAQNIDTGRTHEPFSLVDSTSDVRNTKMNWIALIGAFLIVAMGVVAASYLLRTPALPGTTSATAAPDTVGTQFSGTPLRFGLRRHVPKKDVIRTQSPLARHLSSRLQRPVEIRVYDDYVDLSVKLSRGEIDLAVLAAYPYVHATREHPDSIRLLATHVTSSGSFYEGSILARKDSPIRHVNDFKIHAANTTFCYVHKRSTSGYLYPRAILRQHGIDPDASFLRVEQTFDHLRSLHMLAKRDCDAAAVYSNAIFEVKDHGLQPESFRLLAGSTSRIPNDAYCVGSTQPKELTQSIRAALLELEPGTDLALRVFGGKSRIRGLTIAHDSDYEPVRRMERYLDSQEAHRTITANARTITVRR